MKIQFLKMRSFNGLLIKEEPTNDILIVPFVIKIIFFKYYLILILLKKKLTLKYILIIKFKNLRY